MNDLQQAIIADLTKKKELTTDDLVNRLTRRGFEAGAIKGAILALYDQTEVSKSIVCETPIWKIHPHKRRAIKLQADVIGFLRENLMGQINEISSGIGWGRDAVSRALTDMETLGLVKRMGKTSNSRFILTEAAQ